MAKNEGFVPHDVKQAQQALEGVRRSRMGRSQLDVETNTNEESIIEGIAAKYPELIVHKSPEYKVLSEHFVYMSVRYEQKVRVPLGTVRLPQNLIDVLANIRDSIRRVYVNQKQEDMFEYDRIVGRINDIILRSVYAPFVAANDRQLDDDLYERLTRFDHWIKQP